jgi:hypothetical protein
MPGWATASQMASASLPSFLPPLRYDELRRHDADPMPERSQLPCPVMGARTRLHADQTGWLLSEERHELDATEGLAKHGLAVRIDAMQTEGILCQIDTQGSNVHVDSSCSVD